MGRISFRDAIVISLGCSDVIFESSQPIFESPEVILHFDGPIVPLLISAFRDAQELCERRARSFEVRSYSPKAMEPVANAGVFVGLAALLAGIAFFIVRMIRINARLQQQTGNDYAQRPADESHWRHGGLTYSNPDDPALVVEKLVGVGYTLNMAHPGVRNRLLLMAGIPIFVIWAVLAM